VEELVTFLGQLTACGQPQTFSGDAAVFAAEALAYFPLNKFPSILRSPRALARLVH
jgi:hypothetical protein